MDTREIKIDKYNNATCYLVSSVFNHCDEGLEIVIGSHSDREFFAISKPEAKEIIKTIVEHYKKRCLTTDEADAIARLI